MALLLPEFFRREDELPDKLFYHEPRFDTFFSPTVADAVLGLHSDILAPGGHVLDLMAGSVSHLPPGLARLTGLGLNDTELRHNAKLNDFVTVDLNQAGFLPFLDDTFDGATCTAGVPYLTRPLETFSEVARSLKSGAPFIVSFSNRLFDEPKAVLVWRAADDAARLRLVRAYFEQTAAFDKTSSARFSYADGDALFAVWAHKR